MTQQWKDLFSTYDGGVDYFIKRLSGLAASYGEGFTERQVFEDFLEASYCAISKAAWLSLMDKKRAEMQEARFAALEKARKPGWPQSLGELLAIAVATLSIQYGDFFGDVASRIPVLSGPLGQFFTPYSLCRLMVSITLPANRVEEEIRSKGLVTIAEPASGGGAQLVAVADTLVDAIKGGASISLHRDVFIEAMDVSKLAFQMTYIATSLCGLSACVKHGNTLTREVFDVALTPTFIHLYENPAFLRFLRKTPDGKKKPFAVMREIGRHLQKTRRR